LLKASTMGSVECAGDGKSGLSEPARQEGRKGVSWTPSLLREGKKAIGWRSHLSCRGTKKLNVQTGVNVELLQKVWCPGSMVVSDEGGSLCLNRGLIIQLVHDTPLAPRTLGFRLRQQERLKTRREGHDSRGRIIDEALSLDQRAQTRICGKKKNLRCSTS